MRLRCGVPGAPLIVLFILLFIFIIDNINIYNCASFNGLMNRMVVFPKFTAFLQHKEIFTLNCEHLIHRSRDACTTRALTVGTVRAVRHCPAL